MSGAPAPRGRKILIVEDERDLAAVLALRLEAMGYRPVEVAHDGPEGLSKLKADPPDAILLDLRLPGMSGWDFCEEVRALSPRRRIPVIIVSADQSRAMGERLKAAGASGFLQKPVEPEELEQVLRSVLAA